MDLRDKALAKHELEIDIVDSIKEMCCCGFIVRNKKRRKKD